MLAGDASGGASAGGGVELEAADCRCVSSAVDASMLRANAAPGSENSGDGPNCGDRAERNRGGRSALGRCSGGGCDLAPAVGLRPGLGLASLEGAAGGDGAGAGAGVGAGVGVGSGFGVGVVLSGCCAVDWRVFAVLGGPEANVEIELAGEVLPLV